MGARGNFAVPDLPPESLLGTQRVIRSTAPRGPSFRRCVIRRVLARREAGIRGATVVGDRQSRQGVHACNKRGNGREAKICENRRGVRTVMFIEGHQNQSILCSFLCCAVTSRSIRRRKYAGSLREA